ncbi:MAG: Zn-dependent exopeptidase M28 [Candidatus Lokiarchaeota archaeon]|nr:Zn-dependent exopeptidase M28 [Candidatus Lokiarchaeota archaeon]
MAKTADTAIDSPDAEMAFIRDVIQKIGPRLPGSPEERRAAELLKEDLSRITGSPAVLEEFTCATKASIGFIPVLGYLLMLVVVPMSFFMPLVTGLLVGWFLIFAVIQIFKYLAWFDVFFPKNRSQNVVSVVEPLSGNVAATIVACAHVDSSWHSPIIFKNPRLARPKLIYGVASAVIYGLILLVRGVLSPTIVATSWDWWNLLVIPFVPGFYFVSRYITWKKADASPGAMDDLGGIAVIRWLASYFREHPDAVPADCRVVYALFGCEEAGLKGSHAFVEKHAGDLLAGACSVILVDGVSDFDYFHVVKGDAWLGTNYDPGLVAMASEVMTVLGIKHDIIKNPEGSTDGASFSRAGIKVVALAAQDTGPASNYHTKGDVPERMDTRVVVLMKKILLELVRRAGAAASSMT